MGDLNELVERLNSAASIIEQWDAWELGAANKPTVRLSVSPSKSIREAADALTSIIAERDGLAKQVERKQDLLDSFISFVHRWTWVKEGNGTSDSERLDVIKHYPPVALHNATALSLDSNKGDGV